MRKICLGVGSVVLSALLASGAAAQDCLFKVKSDTSLKDAMTAYHEVMRALVHGPAEKGDYSQVKTRAAELAMQAKGVRAANLPEKLAARCPAISKSAEELSKASDGLAEASRKNEGDDALKAALDRAHKAYRELNGALTTLDDLLEAFHELMHPLWHDAYPKKDAAAIKAQIPRMKVRAKLILGTAEASDKAKAAGAKGLLEAVTTLEEAAVANDDKAVLEALRLAHDAYEKLAEGHN